MDNNCFKISPINEGKIFSFNEDKKLIENEILKDNFLFFNRKNDGCYSNILDLFTSIITTNKEKDYILNRLEKELNFKVNIYDFDIYNIRSPFNDINLENLFNFISKTYHINIYLYIINYEKLSLNYKLYSKTTTNTTCNVKILYRDYSFVELKEKSTLNSYTFNKLNVLEDTKVEKSTISTYSGSKDSENDEKNTELHYSKILKNYLINNYKEDILYSIPYNTNLYEKPYFINILKEYYPNKTYTNKVINIKEKEYIENNKEREFGMLKFFDEGKGFGFIILEKDGSDIFVHLDDINKIIIDFDIIRIIRKKFIIRFSFISYYYYGKHNKSRKAIELNVEEIYLQLK